MLTLESFEQASEIVKQVTQETKLIKSSYFSELTGNKVYLKPENMQRTGAYKVRGAYYKISTLSDEERNKGLITASAGNHAQGVAYAAHKYGVKAVIVMPTTTPLIKLREQRVTVQRLSCMVMYMMRHVHMHWNLLRKRDIPLSILSMIRQLPQDRVPLQWRSFRSFRLLIIFWFQSVEADLQQVFPHLRSC